MTEFTRRHFGAGAWALATSGAVAAGRLAALQVGEIDGAPVTSPIELGPGSLLSGKVVEVAPGETAITVATNASLQTVGSTQVEDVHVTGTSKTNGSVGISSMNTASLRMRNVAVQACSTGFQFRGTQFSDFYSAKAYFCRVGFDLRNIPRDGGGNSNLFVSPQAIGCDVGFAVIRQAPKTLPLHSIELISPQFLGNGRAALVLSGVDLVNVRGWAAESNGGGAAGAFVVDHLVVPRCSVFMSNSTAVFDGGYVAEAKADPAFILRGGSTIELRSMHGYGVPSGALVDADAGSGVLLSGTYGCIGSVNRVRHVDVDVVSTQGLFAGPLHARVRVRADNGLREISPLAVSRSGASSVQSSAKGFLGEREARYTIAASGRMTLSWNVSVRGSLVVVMGLKASEAVVAELFLDSGFGLKKVRIAADEWNSLAWWHQNVTDSKARRIQLRVTGNPGSQVCVLPLRYLAGTAGSRAGWNELINGGYPV